MQSKHARLFAVAVFFAALFSLPARAADWAQVSGSLVQVSAADATHVVGVNSGDSIYRWAGTAWSRLPGEAINASIATDDTLWVVNRAGVVYQWATNKWAPVAGPTDGGGTPVQVSVGSASNVWLRTGSGSIYRRVGTGWLRVGGALISVSAAADGTVMGVNPSGQVVKWGGGDSWTSWPSSPASPFTRLSAGSATNFWAVSQDGTNWRWNGQAWFPVPGKLTLISTGADGRTWGINSANQIYQRDGSWLVTVSPPPTNGAIRIANPAGGGDSISCKYGSGYYPTCSAWFPFGTVLVAGSTVSSYLATSWSGGTCSGTAATCSFTVTGDITLSATFTTTLTATAPKNGSISGGGLSCGSMCSNNFAPNTNVTLSADPAPGFMFKSWDGDCAGQGRTCTLTMSQGRSVSATFSN